MPDNKPTPRERLASLVGFDPGSCASGSAGALQTAVAEIKEERGKQATVKAKEAIEKAMALCQKFEATRKAFKKEETKFNKELGQLMNQIEKLQGNQPSGGDGGECSGGSCDVPGHDHSNDAPGGDDGPAE